MRRTVVLPTLILFGVAVTLLQPTASSQSPEAAPRRTAEDLLRLSKAAEVPGLAIPFKGITTNGDIESGLFGIRSTGVSTEPVRKAAEAFLASLTEPQRAKTVFGHARIRMDEVKSRLDRTWFAWIGATDPGSVFYYRIHSPVILIAFDHQRPAALRHLSDPNLPNREHVHTVVRTPNGNDYGKDLLRLHYLQHPHSALQAG